MEATTSPGDNEVFLLFFLFRSSYELILNPNFVCKYKYFMSARAHLVKNERKIACECRHIQWQQWHRADETTTTMTMIIPILLMRLLSLLFFSCLLDIFSLLLHQFFFFSTSHALISPSSLAAFLSVFLNLFHYFHCQS